MSDPTGICCTAYPKCIHQEAMVSGTSVANIIAERDRLDSENKRLKEELKRMSCPICGSDCDGNNWKSRCEKLVEALTMMRDSTEGCVFDAAKYNEGYKKGKEALKEYENK